MKIQRRRPRVVVTRNADQAPDLNSNDEVIDGELSDAEEMDDTSPDNEIESHLEQNGTTVAPTNGLSSGNSSENAENGNIAGTDGTGGKEYANGHADGNGATAARSRTVVPNLPRRRGKPLDEEAPEEAEPVAPPPSRVPTPPARTNGVALPSRSKSTRQSPAQAAAISSVAPTQGPSAPVGAAVAPAPREPLMTQAFRLIVTYENLIFLVIFALAIVTRFWDLGDRGIHHDESLHSVYSRNLYMVGDGGSGYTHDPMMHGPLQFNFIAVMFWLFGTSDTTTRFASAICGIFVVMSPFFLRKQMGRWPALIASFLFLVSPSILYFSRMAREDSVYAGMEMVMIVGLWRFVSTRKPADFFIFMAGLSLMFTIKETAYLTFAVLAIFFGVMFAFQAGYAILGSLAGYGAVMGAFYLFISSKMKSGDIPKLPDIPATSPDYNTIMSFVTSLFTHPLVEGAIAITVIFIVVLSGLFITQRRRLAYQTEMETAQLAPPRRAVRTANGTIVVPARSTSLPSRRMRPSAQVDVEDAPAPIIANGKVVSTNGSDMANGRTNGHVEQDVVLPAQSSDATGEWVDTDSDDERLEATEVWDPKRLDPKPGSLLGRYQPGSIPYLLGSLFSRPSVILIGVIIASAIFIVLYSVFFTDLPRGILSGLFASLGYWMAQQGVARGDQPWYYYLLIIPLYEPIAVFFSIVATVFFSVKGIRALMRRREERYYNNDPGLTWFNIDRSVPFAKFSVLLPAFLIWWSAAALVLYSWAGEKMPWLTIHLARPAILLASLFLGALLASMIRRRQERLEYAAEYGYGNAYGNGNGYGYDPDYGYGYDERAIAPPESPEVPRRRSQGQAAQNVPQRRRGAEAAIPAPPPRRRPAPRPMPRVQEAPWLAWNRPDSLFPVVSFLVLFTLLTFAWGLKMNWLTKNDLGSWWQSWIYPVLAVILIISYAVWLGPGRALRYAAVGIFAMFFVYEFKSATALAYQHPDVPIEMETYVQTSPDVTRSVKELNDYSEYATGGTNLKVVYDSFTSWPFEWYLRDYKNKQFIGDGAVPTGPDDPVLFLEYAKHNNDPKLSDYVVQRYAMRWWFPEETYKTNFMPGLDYHSSPAMSQIGAAINTSVSTVTDAGRMSSMWQYLLFRKLPDPLGSEDMVVAIRRDIAQQWHYLQYQPPVINDVPPAPANAPIMSDDDGYNK